MRAEAILMVTASVLLLAGCSASREQLAARDDAECLSYGAKPGSDAYVQCRAMKGQSHAAQERQDSAMAAGAMNHAAAGFRY
jgi:hypothetical protein